MHCHDSQGRSSCWLTGGERGTCCMSRHLWQPHPYPALYGLGWWAKQQQHQGVTGPGRHMLTVAQHQGQAPLNKQPPAAPKMPEGDRDLTEIRRRQLLKRERLDIHLVAVALGAGVYRKAGSSCQASRSMRQDKMSSLGVCCRC